MYSSFSLLESRSKPDRPIADANVEYLHRTVKDFVERAEIWSKLLEVTDDTYNPYIGLCNAQIIMLKVGYVYSIRAGVGSDMFWNIISAIIEYATRADPACRTGLQLKLLNELDSAAAHATSLRNNVQCAFGRTFIEEFSRVYSTQPPVTHWTGTRLGPGMKRYTCQSYSFLHLAIQFQLYDYVRCSLSVAKPIFDADTITYGLLFAIIGCKAVKDEDYLDRPSIKHDTPDAGLVDLLLAHGADPNCRFPDALRYAFKPMPGPFSPWEAYWHTWSTATTSYFEVGRSFLDHGADPCLINNARMGNELWSIAKKKRLSQAVGIKVGGQKRLGSIFKRKR